MILTKPDFKLPKPNPRTSNTTNPVWWLVCYLLAAESSTRDAGTYANKPGFHNKGSQVRDAGVGSRSTDYSIRDAVNRTGPYWKTHSSAFDWTFTTAQAGSFTLIAKYCQRLMKSNLDAKDPRLDLILFEWYGQADSDRTVEGYDELHERPVSSDPSHLWHIHFSFLRSRIGDFWNMWALYTVLIGWSVAQWRASLPSAPTVPTPPKPPAPSGLPVYALGKRVLRNATPDMKGTDVLFVQKFIGPTRMGKADGIAGAKFEEGVKWYQRMRGIAADGEVGPVTWRQMGIR